MPVEFWPVIARTDVRANPDKIFLFGDNLERRGLGGQAATMRGEPNAVGIPTKKRPAPGAFFSDDEFEENKRAIDAALAPVFEAARRGVTIVIPKAGIGTGRARLPAAAPRTFEYLRQRIAELAGVPPELLPF